MIKRWLPYTVQQNTMVRYHNIYLTKRQLVMQWDELGPLCHRKHWRCSLCLISFHHELWIHILGKASHSAKIYKIQNNLILISTGCSSRDLCRDLFRNLKILPLHLPYVLLLLLFVVDNRNTFILNSDTHHINTRKNATFHNLSPNLSLYKKWVYSIGIKVFNSLYKVSKIKVIKLKI